MNLIIKGLIIGLGKIIPGVSGSMLAISLGVYEKLINTLANLKENFIKQANFLSKIGIGIIISIVLTSKIVVDCLNNHYLPTMLLFIGMIIGGMPSIIKKINVKKTDTLLIILSLIIFTLILSNNNSINNVHEIKYTFKEFLKLIGIGFIDALSSIVPGISGTAILMTLGYYNIILKTFSTILKIDHIADNLFILIPFIIGFILGIIIVSKILNILFKKNKNSTYIVIMIFMLLTNIMLIKNTIQKIYNIKDIIIGIPLFIIGYIIVRKLEKNSLKI